MTELKGRKRENGLSLIELLIVAAFVGVLLAIAVPNLIKARVSSNEANIKKMLQVLRDAETQYFEQDLDRDGIKNYTAQIGDTGTYGTLRCPLMSGICGEKNALVDESFEGAVASGADAECDDPKSGYCVKFAEDVNTGDPSILQSEFGWEASMVSVRKAGIRDFAVYEDWLIRCKISLAPTGASGKFQASRMSQACD